MFTILPRRYHTPKWQAYVTETQAFGFINGTKVRNLFELKQALSTLPEDVINHHLDNRHDIADWVEFSVKDVDLAQELRRYTHRWGLIVALERQMMRTLNMPEYVAKRWLETASQPFTFKTGESCDSLETLAACLEKVSDETVEFHQERLPNDISKWVHDIIGDYELADLLEEAANRMQMQSFVTDHIHMLKEAAES